MGSGARGNGEAAPVTLAASAKAMPWAGAECAERRWPKRHPHECHTPRRRVARQAAHSAFDYRWPDEWKGGGPAVQMAAEQDSAYRVALWATTAASAAMTRKTSAERAMVSATLVVAAVVVAMAGDGRGWLGSSP